MFLRARLSPQTFFGNSFLFCKARFHQRYFDFKLKYMSVFIYLSLEKEIEI